MTLPRRETVFLAVCLAATIALWIAVYQRPVVDLDENPYAACVAEADQSSELKKIGVPVSAACLGF